MPVNYKAFLPEVSIDVPGCPDPFMTNYIRKAAIEFCELTHIWKQTLTPVPFQADVAIHDFDLEDGEAVLTLQRVNRSVDGFPMLLPNEDEMDTKFTFTNWRTTTGKDPLAIIIVNRNQFRVYPIPTSATTGNAEIHAILKPSRASFEVPTWLHEEHVDAIAAGAKKKLLAMARRPWHDPKQATYYTNQFNNAVGIAKSQARKSYGKQNLYAPLIKI